MKSSVERTQRDYTMAWLSCPVLKRFRQFQDEADGWRGRRWAGPGRKAAASAVLIAAKSTAAAMGWRQVEAVTASIGFSAAKIGCSKRWAGIGRSQ